MKKNYDEQLDMAICIAAKLHSGQKDKSGINYILHPLTVMMNVDTIEEKIVAVLHDIVEDTDINLDNLIEEGFSENIVKAIDCITKRKDEQYMDYIKRVEKNSLAKKVKLMDLKHNMRSGCPDILLNKYKKAYVYLNGE